LLNTPARIAWYSERIPFLEFLKTNESMMFEYGHLYADPDIGLFCSRLSPEELGQTDIERSEEAAMVLDQFQEDSTYARFLELYTPVNDPFLHEARVHLFRRDRHLQRSEEFRDDEEKYRGHLMVAFRENQIMERYFPHTYRKSSYVWNPERTRYVEANMLIDEDDEYESAVSWHLITRVSERQILGGLVLLLVVLGILYRYYGKKEMVGASSRPV
jgi:hypothetical protein